MGKYRGHSELSWVTTWILYLMRNKENSNYEPDQSF